MNAKTLGEFLKARRLKTRMSVEAVARLIGVIPSYVKLIESGEGKLPLRNFRHWAKAYGVSFEQMRAASHILPPDVIAWLSPNLFAVRALESAMRANISPDNIAVIVTYAVVLDSLHLPSCLDDLPN